MSGTASAILQRILRFVAAAPAVRSFDWRESAGYSELSRRLRDCDMAVDEFVTGPIELYFQWIEARPDFRGDQARIMQHVRGSVDDFSKRISLPDQVNLDRRMRMRLDELSDRDRWLFGVWNGVAGHHGV